MTNLKPCPECVQGKHRNCDGRTWDNDQDDYAKCPCAENNHGAFGEPMTSDEFDSIIDKAKRTRAVETVMGLTEPRRTVTGPCPQCGMIVPRVVYDIGSGPELSCANCEWCWGADGQDLKDVDLTKFWEAFGSEQKMVAQGTTAKALAIADGPNGEGWKHWYSHRCEHMGEHHPDGEDRVPLPIPCSHCSDIETYTRHVPYNTDDVPRGAPQ